MSKYMQELKIKFQVSRQNKINKQKKYTRKQQNKTKQNNPNPKLSRRTVLLKILQIYISRVSYIFPYNLITYTSLL